MEKFSSFLTSRRKEMKLSQSELGDILGYSMQTISNWETGRCLPDLCLWDNLARALDIDVTGLLTMEIRNEDNFENRHFDMDAFRKNLKQLRVSQGLTQIDLAQITHTNNKTVSFWESGVSTPSMENFFALKTLFGITIRSLYYGFVEKESFEPNKVVPQAIIEQQKPKVRKTVAKDIARYALFSSIVLGGVYFVAFNERDKDNFIYETQPSQVEEEINQIKFKTPVIEDKFETVFEKDKQTLEKDEVEMKQETEMDKKEEVKIKQQYQK